MSELKTYIIYDPVVQNEVAQPVIETIKAMENVTVIPFEKSAKTFPGAIDNADALVIVMGKVTKTKSSKVRPQLEYAVNTTKPIIGVNVNGMRAQDTEALPTLLKNRGLLVVNSLPEAIQKALKEWPAKYDAEKFATAKGTFRLTNEFYDALEQESDE